MASGLTFRRVQAGDHTLDSAMLRFMQSVTERVVNSGQSAGAMSDRDGVQTLPVDNDPLGFSWGTAAIDATVRGTAADDDDAGEFLVVPTIFFTGDKSNDEITVTLPGFTAKLGEFVIDADDPVLYWFDDLIGKNMWLAGGYFRPSTSGTSTYHVRQLDAAGDEVFDYVHATI